MNFLRLDSRVVTEFLDVEEIVDPDRGFVLCRDNKWRVEDRLGFIRCNFAPYWSIATQRSENHFAIFLEEFKADKITEETIFLEAFFDVLVLVAVSLDYKAALKRTGSIIFFPNLEVYFFSEHPKHENALEWVERNDVPQILDFIVEHCRHFLQNLSTLDVPKNCFGQP